jgi:hypothetical protein
MSIRDMVTLSGLNQQQAFRVIAALRHLRQGSGPPPVLSHSRRVLLVLVMLRTGLTQRGLAAIFGVSQATVHRTIRAVLPQLAALHPNTIDPGVEHLFLDGTLIPAHDHARTARSKNYRRSINTQIVATHQRRIVFVGKAWPGNRNFHRRCARNCPHRANIQDGRCLPHLPRSNHTTTPNKPSRQTTTHPSTR